MQVCAGLLLVIASLFLYTNANHLPRYNPVVTKVIGLIGIVLFGLMSVAVIQKLLWGKPGILLSEEGIENNTLVIKRHFIKWDIITSLKIKRIKSATILLVFINNADEIYRQVGAFSRFGMRMNNKFYGTPVSINCNALKCSLNDLLNAIEQYSGKKIE